MHSLQYHISSRGTAFYILYASRCDHHGECSTICHCAELLQYYCLHCLCHMVHACDSFILHPESWYFLLSFAFFSLPPPTSPLATIRVFSECMRLFLCCEVCLFWSPRVGEIIWDCLCLTSFTLFLCPRSRLKPKIIHPWFSISELNHLKSLRKGTYPDEMT